MPTPVEFSAYLLQDGHYAFRCFLKNLEARCWKINWSNATVVIHKTTDHLHPLPASLHSGFFDFENLLDGEPDLCWFGVIRPYGKTADVRLLVVHWGENINTQKAGSPPRPTERKKILSHAAKLATWGILPKKLTECMANDHRPALTYFQDVRVGAQSTVLLLPSLDACPQEWVCLPIIRDDEDVKSSGERLDDAALTEHQKKMLRWFWYNVYVFLCEARFRRSRLSTHYFRPRDFPWWTRGFGFYRHSLEYRHARELLQEIET